LDFVKLIIEKIGSLTGSSQLEVLIYLVFGGLFIWMYRELKEARTKQLEKKENAIETVISVLSPILAFEVEYNESKNEVTNSKEFYSLVYGSYPFIDYKLFNDIEDIINKTGEEQDKINEIKNVIQGSIKELIYKRRRLLRPNLITEDIEQYLKKFINIIVPVFESLLFFWVLSVLLLIATSGINSFWMVIKPCLFIIMCLQVAIIFDLISFKKLSWLGIIFFIISILIVPIIIVTKGWLPILFLVMWAGAIIISFLLKKPIVEVLS
jgi:hypothetical protein